MSIQATALVPDVLKFPSSDLHLPALIARAGDRAALRFLEFFTVNIRNKNTGAAYARAAAYIEGLQSERSSPTVKQHLACIRLLFDWLVIGQFTSVSRTFPKRLPEGRTLQIRSFRRRIAWRKRLPGELRGPTRFRHLLRPSVASISLAFRSILRQSWPYTLRYANAAYGTPSLRGVSASAKRWFGAC